MEAAERNRALFGGAFGRIYSFYMGREPVARAVGRLVWGGDIRPFYERFDTIAAALDEAQRCLRPGGSLVGASFVTGSGLRNRLLIRPRHSAFGLVVGPDTLRGWLSERFELVEFEVSGPFAYFRAA